MILIYHLVGLFIIYIIYFYRKSKRVNRNNGFNYIVIYPDGGKTRFLRYEEAYELVKIFKGKLFEVIHEID